VNINIVLFSAKVTFLQQIGGNGSEMNFELRHKIKIKYRKMEFL